MKCEFLKNTTYWKSDIKPDFSQMEEKVLSPECIELVRHGREGLKGLRLFTAPEIAGVLFVYDTDDGEYVMPLTGYNGCAWEDEMVDSVASSPVVDKCYLAVYKTEDAKIVPPEEFFDNCYKDKSVEQR